MNEWMNERTSECNEMTWHEIISDVMDQTTNFKVYPNPVRSMLFIEVAKGNNIISMYSLQGLLVKKVFSSSNTIKIDVNGLPSGIYFVEIVNDKGKEYKKIIVR